MAVDVARTTGAPPPTAGSRKGWIGKIVEFYDGIMQEMRKVTWPDVPQVRQATIAIIIFVLLIALVITAMDTVLNGILVKLIPSLFGGR